MNLHRRPLFLISMAYIGGIVCAAEMSARLGYRLFLILSCVLVVSLIRRKAIALTVAGMLVSVFAIGFIRTMVWHQVASGDVSHHARDQMVYLTGVVTSDVEPTDDDARFVLRATRVKTYSGEFATTGLVMVKLWRPRYVEEQGHIPAYGETVRIHGRLGLPRGASNPGGFDYARYLARKRVFCMMGGYTNETKTVTAPGHTPRWFALRIKTVLISQSEKLFRPTNAALLLGMLLGNYAALPLGVQSAFMRSGTMHLLAASGYNCAVVVTIFGFILKKITVPRAITHCILIALVWGFTLVVGPSASIVRAAAMVTVFLVAYLIWRAPDVYSIVSASVLAILAVNPMDIYDIGFQLSFAAVFAIISMLPLLEPGARQWLRLSPRLWEKDPSRMSMWIARRSQEIVVAVLLASVVGIWTWPITAYYFNYLSLVSVVANALVALLVVWLTVFGIASLVLGWIWLPLGQGVAVIEMWLTEGVLRIVSGLGMHPWSSLSLKSPSPILIALYYIILFGVLEYAHRKATRVQGMAHTSSPGPDCSFDLVPGARNKIGGTRSRVP